MQAAVAGRPDVPHVADPPADCGILEARNAEPAACGLICVVPVMAVDQCSLQSAEATKAVVARGQDKRQAVRVRGTHRAARNPPGDCQPGGVVAVDGEVDD